MLTKAICKFFYAHFQKKTILKFPFNMFTMGCDAAITSDWNCKLCPVNYRILSRILQNIIKWIKCYTDKKDYTIDSIRAQWTCIYIVAYCPETNWNHHLQIKTCAHVEEDENDMFLVLPFEIFVIYFLFSYIAYDFKNQIFTEHV